MLKPKLHVVAVMSVSLVAVGSVLAFPTDARAQLQGNTSYNLGNNNCLPLTGVEVIVDVTQDIVVASSTAGNGFSMQLNANGPNPNISLSAGPLWWQQFIIDVDTQNLFSGGQPGVDAYIQESGYNAALKISPSNLLSMGAGPSTLNQTFLRIPAGTSFTWKLGNDSAGNITSATFSAADNLGTQYTQQTMTITGDQTPIYSLQMLIVGYNNGSFTTFQSGAGNIYYIADNFSSTYSYPSCAGLTRTGENSNMDYGAVVSASGVGISYYTQPFYATTEGSFQNGNWGYTDGGYPSSLGDWAYGDYKGMCPLGAPMYGVSRVVGQIWTHDVECGTAWAGSAYANAGSSCYARTVGDVGGFDNRGDTDGGWKWDAGSYQTECAANEFVAGISQNAGDGYLTSILCCPAKVTHQSCDTQVFYNSTSPAYAGPDWDYGYYKGQCPVGQYVAGISTPAYTSIGIVGAAHAILCCSP